MKTLLHVPLVVMLAGCGLLPPVDPTHTEQRVVTPITDQSRVLTLKEPEVWYDGFARNRGIRLPAGAYALEASDASFLYFHAPERLEIRTFSGPNHGSEMPVGGIALAKNTGPSGIFAEAYTDGGDDTTKTLIWKLGTDFERMQGDKWSKNFK